MALLMAVANIIQHFAIREWFHRLVVSHTAIVNVAPSPLPRLSPFSIHVYIFSSNISFSCAERNKKKERTIPVYTAIASHVTKAKKGSERGRETLSARFVERGVSNYSMSIATTIQPVVERAKIHREFSIVMRRGIHRDVTRRPDLSAIAYRDVTMLIETRRNYTEPTQRPTSLPPSPPLFTRRAWLPRFVCNATPLVPRTIGGDKGARITPLRVNISITLSFHAARFITKKKKEKRSQSVIFWLSLALRR